MTLRGQIIMLNGTSSSGKTSLVRALQDALPGPWLEIGIDRFVFALPRRYRDQPGWSELFRYVRPDGLTDGPFRIETGPLGQRLVSGMHHTVAALASLGHQLIVDHVILERAWLAECTTLFAPHEVLFVGVQCPLDVVEARERSRKDRTIGQAAAQLEVVHAANGYDLEVDTSVLSAGDCARQVVETLESGFPSIPFGRVRRA